MNEQVIAFLLKYQEMRKLQNAHLKHAYPGTFIKAKQIELELDQLAPKILAALELK